MLARKESMEEQFCCEVEGCGAPLDPSGVCLDHIQNKGLVDLDLSDLDLSVIRSTFEVAAELNTDPEDTFFD